MRDVVRTSAIALALAALAACSAAGDEQSAEANNATVVPQSASPQANSGEAPEDSPVPLEGNGSDATPRTLAEIPTGFRGRWDANHQACAQPPGEMRLVVSGDNLRFYESVGQVLAVRPDEEAVAIDLRTSGEGETRTETRMLRMTSDGRLSVESGGTSATRVRCPD